MRKHETIWGGLAAVALAAASLVVAVPGVVADTFGPGATGTFTVPAGVCQVTIAAWGGKGANSAVSVPIGGTSGRIQADFPVSPGDVLTYTVGQPGSSDMGGAGFHKGGDGNGDGRGGGGSSAVTLSGAPLIIAAGGGGAGKDQTNGGNGGIVLADGEGGTPRGDGGAANGTPGPGTDGLASLNGGGGGAGAAPGKGGGDGQGGGGGGNSVSSSATTITDPGPLGSPAPPGGEVRIAAAEPGIGCVVNQPPKPAPAASPYGIAALLVALAGFGVWRVRKRAAA